jgi:hypothetical protein
MLNMRFYWILIFLLSGFIVQGQCSFDNSFLQDATPTSCPGNVTVPCVNGGEYITVNAVAGQEYTFSTCSQNNYDTQITVYNASGTAAIAYNDDQCGLQSSITFIPSSSGVLNVLIDQYDCQNSGGCTALEITCDIPPPPTVFTDSNLPIVIINTAGGAAIPNEPKLDATMGIINNGAGNRNYVTDPFNEYQGDIGIEIRGSSSSGFPKKQWGLETRDPSGQNVDVSIFNMAYDNDWVLYAPYSDKSLLRNVLTYKMGWDTERFAPRTQLCEVVLNGEYQGVYVFIEKIKRKDGKVGINSVETTENSGNEITGDYILKVDKFTAGGQLAWVSPFPPYAGATSTVKFQMHSPSIDSITPQQLNYIQTKVTDFETALDGPNFSDPVLGFAPYIDMSSFIDFFLVNEFGKNVDGYRISSYFHKRRDSEGGKIVAGPLWDFNLAFGNANYCAGGNTTGWELDFYLACGGDGFQNPFWWKKLTQDINYAHDLNCRWQELRLGAWHTDTLMAYIDSMAVYLDESQQRNFNKWQILGNYVWPNNFVGNTYAEEINYLKTWITNRAAWLDANMFGSCTDLGIPSHYKDNVLVFPNPASNSVNFQFENPVMKGVIELYQASGQLIQKQQLAGTAAFTIDVSTLNSGVYYYKIVDETKRVETGKLNIQH